MFDARYDPWYESVMPVEDGLYLSIKLNNC